MASENLARERVLRRIVWVVIAIAILIPIIWPFDLEGTHVAPEVQKVYDQIESIPARGIVLVSLDFEPGSKPELEPMAIALCRHAFARDLRVVGMGLWVTGVGLAEQVLTQAAREFGKDRGKDWCFLGWAPGAAFLIQGMGQDLYGAYPKDARGDATRGMPVLEGVQTLRNFDYVVSLAAGTPGVEEWVTYGSGPYGFALGGGCTGVIAPQLIPFVQTGQLKGFLGAMKGGAEYESLLGKRDDMVDREGRPLTWNATAGMQSLSFAHFALIGLIILGNVAQWVGRKKGA